MATVNNLDLHVPDEVRVGIFANAFRVIQDTGDEILLDFVVYSSSECKGVVVARVRAHKSFLAALKERVDLVLTGPVTDATTKLTVPPDGIN